jgi:hypothetical protein
MVGIPNPSKENTKSAGTCPFAAEPNTRTNCWQKKISSKMNKIAIWLLKTSFVKYLVKITLLPIFSLAISAKEIKFVAFDTGKLSASPK